MQNRQYKITLVESPEGWAVWCDELPGCASQGSSRDEALANIRIAIREYQDAQENIQARFHTRVFHELVDA